VVGLATAALALSGARQAAAVNPLESPDNGAQALGRGGANLAVGSHPLSAHYGPASLAQISSAASIDVRLSLKRTCYTRLGPDGSPTGPTPGTQYVEVCNRRQGFPLAIPALALTWRATDRLGFGIAVVPPATYGTASTDWAPITPVRDVATGQTRPGPASYRYQSLGNQSTILLPTVSVGYAVTDALRVGVGFVSGMAAINVRMAGLSSVQAGQSADDPTNDTLTRLRARDSFMPGVVLSVHASVTPWLDAALWGRWVDSIDTTDGDLTVQTQYYARPGLGSVAPLCGVDDSTCSTAIQNTFRGSDFERFRFAYPPPELRAGLRYHAPRSHAVSRRGRRDPLVDDVFDVELDGSYTMNHVADEVTVRFRESSPGTGPSVRPVGNLPPIADRPTGFIDSFGARLGGQWNALPGRLGILAGGWVESRSQKPELLDVSQPGPLRGGFGGGLVVRRQVLDVSISYQLHLSQPLDNRGHGALRAPAANELGGDGFSTLDEPQSLPAVDRREFRSPYVVNGGRVTATAHVLAIGAVVRF
jgi:long-chain fatty acid transport protein